MTKHPIAVSAVLASNTALVVASFVNQLSFGWFLVGVLWLNALIYTTLDRSRVFAFFFLTSFFIFLLSRPVVTLLLDDGTFEYSADELLFLERALLLTLTVLYSVYLLLGLFSSNRKQPARLDARHNGFRYEATSLVLRKWAGRLYWLLFPGAIYSAFTQFRFVETNSYRDLYTSEFVDHLSSNIQTLVSYMSDAAFVALVVYLSTMPRMRAAVPLMLGWSFVTIFLLIAGQRRDFLLAAILFVGFLAFERKYIGGDRRPRLRKGVVITALATLPALVAVLSLMERVRGLEGDMPSESRGFLFDFLHGQGVTANTLLSTHKHEALLPDQFYLAEFAHRGIVARLLNLPIYQGNSLERAENGGSLSHSVSQIVLGDLYLDGVSTGSSFVAEGYATWGFLGIAIVSAAYGLLLYQIGRLGKGGPFADAIRLLIVQDVLWAPRGSSTGFVGTMLAPMTITVFGLLLVLVWVSSRRKSLPASEPGIAEREGNGTTHSTSKPKLLISGLTENRGGKEVFIYESFKALRNDYECWFLVDRKVAFADEISSAGGVIYPVPRRGSSPFRYVTCLLALFRGVKFDAVWLNQTVINSIEPLIMAKLFGTQVRALHSHSTDNLASRFTGALHRIQKPVARVLSNRKFACSVDAGRWFFAGSNFTVIPNSFDVELFSYDARKRAHIRKELGLSEDMPLIIQLGHLGPVKNHAFSLALMKVLKLRRDDIRLLIVGDGPLRRDLEAQVDDLSLTDRVIFLGSRSDVPALLSASDLMILPSKFEGLPYVLLEAQASTLPAVVSDTVTKDVDVTGQISFLSLDAGLDTWGGRVLEKLSCSERSAENPLADSQYDSAHSRELYLGLLGAKDNLTAVETSE